MDKKTALKIIEKNRKSYNKIAHDFDITRQASWPEFDLLAPLIKKGDKILDIGCGNGRLFKYLCSESNSEHYVGVDISDNLIKIAKRRYAESNSEHKAKFKVVDKIWELPFENNSFDIAAGIAFLHHIPNQDLRLKVLREIYRVLKPGGILFLTNWNLWQRRKKYGLRIRDFFLKHNGLDAGDFWINFQGIPRYYHQFRCQALKYLLKKAGFKIKSCKTGKNVVTIAYT